jgi:hypothetical protein
MAERDKGGGIQGAAMQQGHLGRSNMHVDAGCGDIGFAVLIEVRGRDRPCGLIEVRRAEGGEAAGPIACEYAQQIRRAAADEVQPAISIHIGERRSAPGERGVDGRAEAAGAVARKHTGLAGYGEDQIQLAISSEVRGADQADPPPSLA